VFDVFLNAVLPIFAVVAAGFGFARAGLFDASHAAAINRFVFYLPLPLLLFRLISTSPLDEFEWLLILVYMIVETSCYAVGFVVARTVFRRSRTESLLLGMTAAFPNHVYFVLPIAQQLYGEAAAIPIIALITVDATLLFGGTILILDATSEAARGASAKRVLARMGRNPQILALVLGLLFNLAGLEPFEGFNVFARFLGDSAAPASLFSLGVILAIQQTRGGTGVALAMTAIKLLALPLAAWIALVELSDFDAIWTSQAMLIAAGPTGAMPFVLALQYQVPTDAIARVVLLTTIGSLLTVTLMAGLDVGSL
jgi:predicted permease